MNKRVPLLFVSVLLSSCGEDTFIKSDYIKVMLEKGNDYDSSDPIKYVSKGENVTFLINKSLNTNLSYVSYQDYLIENIDETHFNLTLNNINYPVVVSLYVTRDSITYHANGGELIRNTGLNYISMPKSYSHLKENAINALLFFKKDGYQPIGFNTNDDYSGERISFGSRLPFYSNDYYVEWKKECDKDEFVYEVNDNKINILKYTGSETEVVIPRYIDDKQVTSIETYSFDDVYLKKVYLPCGIKTIKSEALYNTNIEEITFFDDIEEIGNNAFPKTLKTVHINAVISPKFSGSYYDTFPDKIDYLNLIQNNKKIVLFSGSSTRYGFYSPNFDDVFKKYKTVNMGVFAYVNIKPQLDIITNFMNRDDVLLSSPEFDVNSLEQQCGTNDFFEWNLFSFVESNFDLLKYIDIRKYPNFFTSFNVFQRRRKYMYDKSYHILAKNYDDEENFYKDSTYNIQGDFILPRDGNQTDSWIMQPLVNYTLKTITKERVDSLNTVYQSLLDKGINVYFTFSPKNRNAIDEDSTYAEIKKSEQYLRDNLIVPVITNWEDVILPGTCFYLIDNHLSSDACIERTNNVINDLKKYIDIGEKE